MEQHNKDSSPEEMPEWKRALVRMTAEHLATVDAMDRWPCISALSPRAFAKMLTFILTVWWQVEMPGEEADRETYNRILVLLGQVATVLTEVELRRWAPEIALSRNRALMDRDQIQDEPSDPA
jgi:hypothetical protein